MRYWLLLLATLVLNILFVVYFRPADEVVCPQIYSFTNGSFNEDLNPQYVIATFVVGSIYAILSFWMVMEYFIVTWPHFVMPKFLYTFKNKLAKNRLTAPFSKYLSYL